MGFIVVHKGDTSERDYRHYLLLVSRWLLNRGVGYDRVPRIPENGRADRWLYVYGDEAEARSLAEELRRDTDDPGWEVRPVEGAPSEGPLTPITVEVSQGSTGVGFGLPPLIKKALRQRFSGCCPHENVWVTTDIPAEGLSTEDLREMTMKVLPVLAGLTLEQLGVLGGFEVIDPGADDILVPFTPLPFSAGDPARGVSPKHSDRVEDLAHCTPVHPG
jgi:hypothetical protein